MDIKPFFISKLTLPRVNYIRSRIFGVGYCNFEVTNFKLEMSDCIHKSNLKTINKWFSDGKPFNLDIEMLDPTGVVYEKMTLDCCYITQIDFGQLDYTDNSLMKYKLTIKPNTLKLE